jgi:hypothetical protein
VPARQMDELHVAAVPLDQRADRGTVLAARDQIAFPVADSDAGSTTRGRWSMSADGELKRTARWFGRRRRLRSGRPVRSRLVNCLLNPPLPP